MDALAAAVNTCMSWAGFVRLGLTRVCFVQLTSEGGWDAAQEAPYVYAALDARAARAGGWGDRQQRLRIEVASEQAASEMAEPVVVAREAIAYVKQVSHSGCDIHGDCQQAPCMSQMPFTADAVGIQQSFKCMPCRLRWPS